MSKREVLRTIAQLKVIDINETDAVIAILAQPVRCYKRKAKCWAHKELARTGKPVSVCGGLENPIKLNISNSTLLAIKKV